MVHHPLLRIVEARRGAVAGPVGPVLQAAGGLGALGARRAADESVTVHHD